MGLRGWTTEITGSLYRRRRGYGAPATVVSPGDRLPDVPYAATREYDLAPGRKSMKRIPIAVIIGCFLVALSAGPSLAYSGPVFVQKGTMHGVPYLDGGVGLGERSALEGMAKGYNLKLYFAMPSGGYLADIKVEIQNSSGKKLVETTSGGPWFFARLPEGNYRITVAYKGHTQVRQLAVGPKFQQLGFWWKS
jgi:hypothetical protein